MANPPTPTSGRVPRGIPKVSIEEVQRNVLSLLGGPLPVDPIGVLKASSPIPIPEEPGEQCDAFLAHILHPGMAYSLVASSGHRPDFPGAVFQKEELLCREYRGAIPLAAPGGFLRFNPVGGEGSGWNGSHCDRDVVGFHYLLAESDSLDLETQASLLLRLVDLGLPVASAVHTGGKSIHALIRVQAANEAEFRILSRRTYARLIRLGFDPSTGNPSRMTRLPGCVRTLSDGSTALQKLLYLA